MFTYSIEQSAEQIYHPKTKEYFNEVLQSYVNGSYRSAVVMLYSVVMCDLIYKLKDLKELYDDEIAKDILQRIEDEQAKDPNKGGWEGVLIEEVKTRTFLLEPADKISIEALRQHRHLSAHPVLNHQDLLATPNKETVRALIRNMLEGLLTKNPVMSKKVFTTILEDLEQHKGFFSDDKSLENYVESRYLKNTNEMMINTIFKDLWAITFNCKSEPCKTNREINFRTLKILYKKYRTSLLKFIEGNKIQFNKFSEDEEDILLNLIVFFGDNPELYEFIETHNQTRLKAKIESEWKFEVRAPFLRESMEKHLDYLIENMHSSEFTSEERFSKKYILKNEDRKLLVRWAVESGCVDKYYDLLVHQAVYSSSFDAADRNFDNFIKPNLKHLKREHFLTLLDGYNRNRQCHGHRFAKQNNTKIKEYSDIILGSNFDYEGEYPNIEFKEETEDIPF
ncbi:hypothetical protein LG298_07510 [Cytobacillus firmus]|uniref:hypothetical protein n=1 Tax=Cytobacillus firmus TaxID=1399 RepID=UPI00385129FC